MKKLLVFVLCLVCLFVSGALGEETETEEVQFIAISHREFSIFSEKENGRRLVLVPQEKELRILEYGEEWCRAEYDGFVGYCKAKHLYGFRSRQPETLHVPGWQPMAGFISFNEQTFIQADTFKGLTALPGQIACVRSVDENGYVLPVWRSEMTVPIAQATFYPFVDWQEAQPGDVIGGFTTFYGPQQGKGMPDQREHNIVVGCEKIHETVWKPDDYFSFNQLCAPYKKNNGYQYAPNISNSGFGYGGGVCQLTTTLYNAVLQLPLQVDEWAMHRYTGIAYAPQFFDAAVGSYSDFTFKNTLPYAIQIMAVPQDGVLTVLIVKQ